MNVVGAEHHIDVTGLLLDQVAVLLGKAPADHDFEIRARRLQRLQVTKGPVQLVVGVLANATRVEHDDIRLVERVGGFHAVGFEQPGDALGVVLIHLAPMGADHIALRHGFNTSAVPADPRPSRQPSPATPDPRPLRQLLVAAGTGRRRHERWWRRLRCRRRHQGRADAQSSRVTGMSALIDRSIGSSSASPSPRPSLERTFSETSTMISGLSLRKPLAFSRPWPSCSPS